MELIETHKLTQILTLIIIKNLQSNVRFFFLNDDKSFPI